MLEAVELPDNCPGLVEHMDLRRFPRVAEMAQMYTTAPDYRFTASFDVGLNRLLDGVERFAEAFPEP